MTTTTLTQQTDQTRSDFIAALPQDQQTIVGQAFQDLKRREISVTRRWISNSRMSRAVRCRFRLRCRTGP
jgi:hypothetical protein